MTKHERLFSKIANKETIILSNTCDSLKTILYFVTFFFIVLTGYIALKYKISTKFCLTITCLFALYFTVLLYIKKFVSASIKGDMLSTKSIFKKKKFTSVRSIRSISSKTYLKFNFTKLSYKLDGTIYNVRLINKIDSEHLQNEEVVKTILKNI